MIKDILVNLTVGTKDDVAAEYAISVAKLFDAHLTGVAFADEPNLPYSAFGISAEAIEEYQAKTRAEAEKVAHTFEKVSRDAGVRSGSRILSATVGGCAKVFSRLARNYDLSIIRQYDSDGYAEDLIIEAALFDSGRPILVVPYIQEDGCRLNRAVLCWDGSRNAARAFSDALPFLERCKDIEIVSITTKDDNRVQTSASEIADHLARHGLQSQVNRIVSGDEDVASTILSHVADRSADIVVMGGYGHSRLREFVLGGATRGMLASMTVPIFMSH